MGCGWKRSLSKGGMGGKTQMRGLLGGPRKSYGWQPLTLLAFPLCWGGALWAWRWGVSCSVSGGEGLGCVGLSGSLEAQLFPTMVLCPQGCSASHL